MPSGFVRDEAMEKTCSLCHLNSQAEKLLEYYDFRD